MKIIYVIILILIFLGCRDASPENSGHERPNIVLIVCDDVALDNLGCYGGKIPTPNIDKIASQGMIFKNAFSNSSTCTPSRFAILTGQYPGRCRDSTFLAENPKDQPYAIAWNTMIKDDSHTLHKSLNAEGYYTGFVGKFHLGAQEFHSSDHNPDIPVFDEALDLFSAEADSLVNIYYSIISERVKQLTGSDYVSSVQWENPEQLPHPGLRNHNLEWKSKGVINFLEEASDKDQPFFLHFNTTALHGPNMHKSAQTDPRITPQGIMPHPYEYHPTRESIYERLKKYGEEITPETSGLTSHLNVGTVYLDDQIGVIFDFMEAQNLLENTLIIITADHNKEPAKSTLYNKGLSVPFISYWKDVINANSTQDGLVQFVDFFPTFLDLANASADSISSFDGKSFKNLLFNLPNDDPKVIYFEEGYTRAVSNGKYKYIAQRFSNDIKDALRNNEKEYITHMGKIMSGHGCIAAEYYPGYFDADQLYDLEKDPYEQNNLAYQEEYQEVLAEMQNELNNFTSKFDHPFPVADNSYMQWEGYVKAVQNTVDKGTDFIPWWDGTLVFPPEDLID